MKKLSVLVLILQLLAVSPAHAQIPPVFNANVVYQLGADIRYRGPEGWLGVVQVNDPATGAPLYAGIPADVRALFIKYDPAKPHPGILFDPTVELKVFRITTGEKNLAFLRRYISALGSSKFLKQPQDQTIQGQAWAVTEFEMSPQTVASMGIKNKKMYRRIFVTEHQGLMILLQLTTIEGEHEKDVPVFDASIAQIQFKQDAPAAAPAQKEDLTPTAKGPVQILSYTLKTGETFSRTVVGETSDAFIVKDEKGEDVIIDKQDMLNFR